MKRALIIFTFVFSSLGAQIYKPIMFPEKVDARYIFSPLKEQEKYYKKLKKSLPKKYAETFSALQTFGKAEKFQNGEIYLSWKAMEDYVNKVLDSIMPPTLTSKKIRAYIGRNSSINAFCLYDGTMIVNVGLLAEVKNEAALASVMGHELAHYIKNHHLNRIKKATNKSSKNRLQDQLNYMGFSQGNELEADKEGFTIAKNAGYDVAESESNFELFIREEEYYAKRNKSSLASTDSVEIQTKAGKFKANTLEKLLKSHPDVKERKDKLAEFIKANPQEKKKKFKIDEEYFMALQAQARMESIHLIFNNNDYQECLERAFIYYLFHPGEMTYTYFVAESIRRLCLLDYRLRKKGFLSENLVNNGFKEGEGILHDLKFLVPNTVLFDRIKATELTGKSYPFETYREAFAYFTKKLVDKNYQEAYLMRALFENNQQKIKENLSKYELSPKAEHKEYAKHYQNNTLAQSIASHTGEIVLIPQVNFYKHTVFSRKYANDPTHYYYKRSEVEGKAMANEFSTAINNELSDVKSISIPLAATQNFNTKDKYQNALSTSLLARRDENEGYQVVHYYKELEDEDYIGKTDIFRLDPDMWEFFNSNKINSISFASYTRHKNATANKTRIICLFFGPVGWLIAAGTTVQYKKLTLFSYDARLGALYFDYDVRPYRLSPAKARKMFSGLRKTKSEYIKNYNAKY
jgi:hypothetical protein